VPHEEPREKGSRRSRQGKSPAQAESVAFMVLAGVALGLGVGYVVGRLVHAVPVFLGIGLFAGFALALYAIYLETR
jgi:F0F1-type ATP synthase assembly protein I